MEIPGFKIERFIAEGGMASVYLAVQESLHRRVALKVLKKFDRPEHAKRFLHEGRIIASLNHRNIITIHDIGVVGDRHYIAMEYLEGGTLGKRIAAGMQMPDILDLMESIGGCLDFVHRKGIVHRDIKPGNVLFHADGTPKLTDFGIAKQLDDDQNLTSDGSSLGSPFYFSPEQAQGRPLDGRSDIYALGIVFFQMLTGRKPYAEDSSVETILAHLTHPIPVLPEEFSAYQNLLERMLAKNPDDRFASAGDLVNGMRELRHSGSQSGSGTPAIRASGLRTDLLRRLAAGGLRRWQASSMALKAALGLAVLSLGAGAILLPGGRGTPRDADVEAAFEPVSAQSNQTSEEASGPGNAAVGLDEQDRSPAETSTRMAAPAEPPASHTTPNETPGAGHKLEAEAESALAAEDPPVQPFPTGGSLNNEEESRPQIAFAEEYLSLQAPDTDSVTGPESELVQAIEQRLQAADRALQEDRLTTPSEDNAHVYYQKVLELDPDQEKARMGIERIADRYATLARTELHRGNYRQADLYVRRGIEVQPDHAELSALGAELDEKHRATARQRTQSRGTQQKSDGSGNVVEGFKSFGKQFKRDFKKTWNDIF